MEVIIKVYDLVGEERKKKEREIGNHLKITLLYNWVCDNSKTRKVKKKIWEK